MQKLAVLVIALIIGFAAYLFLSSPAPNPGIQDEAVDAQTQAEARAHIAELTGQSGDSAIAVGEANHFVTADQLLTLPDSPAQSLALSAPVSGADGATTFAADLNLPPAGDSAAETGLDMPTLNRLRLQELLNEPDNGNRIFYIHGVNLQDRQGLWGIVQRGLTDTFAQGIQLGEQRRTLSTQIPQNADERLQDASSSFLGHILNRKVSETLIYNYEQGLLGEDPNLIKPGQQLIIVRFTEDELISIYNHFKQQASNGSGS